MSLRLLFVIDSLVSGGAQRQMVTLAQGLKARGHDVEFFLYAPGDTFLSQLQTTDIPVFRHLKTFRFSPGVIWALRQHIKAGQYDLVLAHMPTPNFYSILASRMIRDRPPTVISERSYDPPNGLPWIEVFVRRFYRFAAHLVVNSEHQCINLRQKLPELRNRITTIYNGLDLEAFSPPEHEPPIPPLKLLGLSYVSPYKNVLCLARALGILAKEYDLRPHVSWAGRHFDKSNGAYFRYRQQIDHEVRDLGLTAQWKWLYERTDVASLLRQHHALVHPSYAEGLPNAVCEAMACGRPVIVSDTLEHPHLIQHGVSGFLFDWRDPHQLAQCIKALHDMSEQQRHGMGMCGRDFAERFLSIETLVDNYEELFTSIVDNT